MEALDVFQNVGVADLGIHTARLVGSGIDDVVVGAAFVGEALTVAVDLQERLRAGVVLLDLAGERLAAKRILTVNIASIHTGSHDAAVEQHGGSFLVQICTGPDGGTDAVALIGRRVGTCGGDAYMKEDLVKKVLDVCSLSYRTFSNFLTGQCLEAVILGTMFVICMGILQMPYAMLIGVLIAFTALIPIFGAFIGCVVGAFLILTVAPMKALVFVIMFLILQQIEGNLIYPRVVGSSVGLPSIWVLAAVSIGASLMGIVGMLVFIPIVSVLYALLRGDVYEHLEKKGIAVDRESGEIYRPKEPDVDES